MKGFNIKSTLAMEELLTGVFCWIKEYDLRTSILTKRLGIITKHETKGMRIAVNDEGRSEKSMTGLR